MALNVLTDQFLPVRKSVGLKGLICHSHSSATASDCHINNNQSIIHT